MKGLNVSTTTTIALFGKFLLSRDETAMLVYKTMAKSRSSFVIIELNSEKTVFAIVLYINMAAVTSHGNRE